MIMNRCLLTLLCSLWFSVHAIAHEAKDEADSAPVKPLFRDYMGINGHTVLFKPELYAPVCRLVRDYHPLDWDTGAESDYKLDFPWARNRVNWETVYGSWQRAQFVTDACIMFETLSPDQWKDKAKDSFRYGEQFAKSLGPSSTLPLVDSVEIGNEPGKYSDEDYRTIFEHMAKGFKQADPKLKVATCNVNVGPSGDYHKSIDCVAGLESLYDILNIHTYAMLEPWPTWRRSYPEDARLESFTGDVERLIAWRDQHAPDKQIWITEFGWDSSTQTPAPSGDFAKWIGNTDLEQAQWLVRSFFLFATMDIDRAYIYFFNDEDTPQFHGASGLTRNFVPKPSFHAVAQLYRLLGDYRFSRVVHEHANEAAVYEFVHGTDANQVVWVAWSPTGVQRQASLAIPLEGLQWQQAEAMATSEVAAPVPSIQVDDARLRLEISESPIYLMLKRGA